MRKASDDMSIYEDILRLEGEGLPCALATVVESLGSSPRKAGAKMLVRSDGSISGSIGGGMVEHQVIEKAFGIMKTGGSRLIDAGLSDLSGHVCGGKLKIFLEAVKMRPRLIMIGAGHIGKAVAELASFSGFHVTIADDRPDFCCIERFPRADCVCVSDSFEYLGRVRPDSSTFIIIAASDFEKDFEAVRAALGTPASYIGLVGSRRKKAVLEKRLSDSGFADSDRDRIDIPAGMAINAETPEEIAVSIIAGLIDLRRKNGATDIRDSSCCG